MARTVSRGLILAVGLMLFAAVAEAQQYASYVMDARTGKVIQAVNAETRVHPASLTKMMTLYVVFDQVRRGRLSLDQKITISARAAAEPPSKLGLKAGQKIELRYLIRAAAIKSANDAATALGEAVGGSEAGFAEIMNQYARAMGLRNTTFKNANGLTRSGHLSTAHDMAEIGRRLYYDFPQYYNIFSRNATSAGMKTVQNTNRRLLDAYPGADGIKTGYTQAAGFALVSSAQRGDKRVIVAVMGARSSASRNAEVARLMDLGLAKMPSQARVSLPAPLRGGGAVVATAQTAAGSSAVTVAAAAPGIAATRGSTAAVAAIAAPDGSIRTRDITGRPMPRMLSSDAAITRDSQSIASAIAEVNSELAASQMPDQASAPAPTNAKALILAGRPAPRPSPVALAGATQAPVSSGSASTFASVAPAPPRPTDAAAAPITVANAGSFTTGGNDWGVQIGAFRSRGDAERQLLTTALQDVPELTGGLRRVEGAKIQGVTVFRAQFVGLSQQDALGACASLARRDTDCMPLAPGI